jgi:hypothetical protein
VEYSKYMNLSTKRAMPEVQNLPVYANARCGKFSEHFCGQTCLIVFLQRYLLKISRAGYSSTVPIADSALVCSHSCSFSNTHHLKPRLLKGEKADPGSIRIHVARLVIYSCKPTSFSWITINLDEFTRLK